MACVFTYIINPPVTLDRSSRRIRKLSLALGGCALALGNRLLHYLTDPTEGHDSEHFPGFGRVGPSRPLALCGLPGLSADYQNPLASLP